MGIELARDFGSLESELELMNMRLMVRDEMKWGMALGVRCHIDFLEMPNIKLSILADAFVGFFYRLTRIA